MNTQRFGLGLTVLNLFLLAILLTQIDRPAQASDAAAMLRGRGLEIVDTRGRVRASISVMPEKSATGATVPETVLLRLITDRGRPAVKISTSEAGGSGMSGPTVRQGCRSPVRPAPSRLQVVSASRREGHVHTIFPEVEERRR